MSDRTVYGGQAVIEGVMMRGRRFVACAVRDPKGNIVSISEPLSPTIYASAWSRVPFLRAVTILWDTLVLGTKMLIFSANIAAAADVKEEPSRAVGGAASGSIPSDAASAEVVAVPAPGASAAAAPVAISGTAMAQMPAPISTGVALGTLAVSLAFGVGLFFVLPLILVNLADPFLSASIANADAASLVSNIIEGMIRLVLFLAYIVVIGLMPDIRRVFQYHGAEHETVAAEEAGAPLTPETIRSYSKEHPRCGTGFLLVVVVVSIFVFALLGRPPIFWRIASRILLIPVVAALGYELIKFSSAHQSNPLLNTLVVKPSLALQSLTTREPDAAMIEVAVAALQRVKAEEGRHP